MIKLGAVRVKTLNDRLLNVDYSDPEELKKIIISWGMVEKLAEGGDTVASAILVDLQRAIGVSITEFGENKKAGFDVSKIHKGVLTEAQFISLVYVLGLGYRQDEIAYVLGCKKQTVNVHIQRALKRICRFLEKEDSKDEKNKKKRRRSSGQVVKRTRSVLYQHEPGKGKNDKTSLSHSRSGSKQTKKRDSDNVRV